MAHSAAKVLIACLFSAALSASAVRADESKPFSCAIYAPGQSDKTIHALTELLSKNNQSASVSRVESLPDAIACKADIVVIALSKTEFESLGPYDADALKQRKLLGIGIGAAKLFGEVGLKISAGNCAHGFEPRIRVEDNATIAKEGYDRVFGVYTPNAQQFPAHDLEFMPFGIYLGDKHPEIGPGLDVIARFSVDREYAPIVRQDNAILIGFNPHAEDWTDLFRTLVWKLALSLNEPAESHSER